MHPLFRLFVLDLQAHHILAKAGQILFKDFLHLLIGQTFLPCCTRQGIGRNTKYCFQISMLLFKFPVNDRIIDFFHLVYDILRIFGMFQSRNLICRLSDCIR